MGTKRTEFIRLLLEVTLGNFKGESSACALGMCVRIL